MITPDPATLRKAYRYRAWFVDPRRTHYVHQDMWATGIHDASSQVDARGGYREQYARQGYQLTLIECMDSTFTQDGK